MSSDTAYTSPAVCSMCPPARSRRFACSSTVSAIADCCRDIFQHRTQVAASISVRIGSVLLLSPLRLLQDAFHRIPFLGHLIDCIASLCDRLVMSLVFSIWLSVITVCPRLLWQLCMCEEAAFAALAQIFGVVVAQPLVELYYVVYVALREVGCLLLLTRSQRVDAQTFLLAISDKDKSAVDACCCSPEAEGCSTTKISLQPSEQFARVFINCDQEYNRGDSWQSFFLGFAWKAAHIATVRDRFTHLIRAKSWSNAFSQLTEISKSGQKIAEVQFAGHGSDGCAFIGTDCFNIHTLTSNDEFKAFVATRPFAMSRTVRPLFWFRTCSTLNSDVGRQFAKALSDAFCVVVVIASGSAAEEGAGKSVESPYVRVAGHTQNISTPNPLLQPGLVCYDPLAVPDKIWWKDGEGPTIGSLTFSPAELMPLYTA